MLSTSFAHAQNQDAVIVAGTLKNFIRLPEEIFFGITKTMKLKSYKKLKEKSTQHKGIPATAVSCEEQCPDNMHVLKNARMRMLADKGGNLLAFLNEKSDFKDHIQRTVGYCWGHTSVTRTLNYLAHFDPESRLEQAPPREEKRKFRRFYRNKILSMMNYKAQVIPGFKNLREFSNDKVIQKILKNQVVWGWADKALKLRSISIFTRSKKGQMTPEALEAFIDETEHRLDLNHAPKIYFTNLKKPGFIHVVNVNEIRRNENEIKVCILDNHQYEDELKDCGVSVSINLNTNEIYYEGWNKPERGVEGFVGRLGFTPEDEVEMLTFQRETRKMCLKQCSLDAESR